MGFSWRAGLFRTPGKRLLIVWSKVIWITLNLSRAELIHTRILIECELASLAVMKRPLESLGKELANLEGVYRERKGLVW
jgi:hypothetical protein